MIALWLIICVLVTINIIQLVIHKYDDDEFLHLLTKLENPPKQVDSRYDGWKEDVPILYQSRKEDTPINCLYCNQPLGKCGCGATQ